MLPSDETQGYHPVDVPKIKSPSDDSKMISPNNEAKYITQRLSENN